MIYKQAKERVDQGLQGLNQGLPMGLPRLSNIINDVQKGRYDLIAGKTSAGKTAFVDQCYVLNPFDYYLTVRNTMEIEVDWLYFSLEISPVNKFTKFAARELYNTYGIVSDMSELMSLGNKKLSHEKREILDTFDPHFEELEKHLHMFDEFDNSDSIVDSIYQFATKHGKFERVNGRQIYTSHHPNHYVVIIIDTVNLLSLLDKQNLKQAIDALSKKMIWFRNICNFSPVVVQQYNADISDPIRIQQRRTEPISDDLEDSKRTSKDCNTYLSVFDPSELGLNKSAGGYNLKDLGNKFRQIQVLKNRDGDRGGRVGCKFGGQIGLFEELPPADQMRSEDYANALLL